MRTGNRFAINVPILAETLFGIRILPRGSENLTTWAQLEPQLVCYVPDGTDAVQAVDIQLSLRRRGRQLATVDALIAVTALRYDLTLLTTDNDFAPVPGLRVENWIGLAS